jgi:aspartyl-tRNA(Asn)/glutamyl-tRNA(Gln) amidotransferase subunit A
VLTEATRIATDLDEWRPHYHYGSMAAVTGLPGVSVPMGFGAAGLPLGITFITDQYQDAAALRIASLFQRATDWHDRHPTLDG